MLHRYIKLNDEPINQTKYLEWIYSAVIKKMSVAELESLIILVGKSIIWNKFKIVKVVSCRAELETMKKFTLKSPQIINSNCGFCKYFKIRSSGTANSPKFPPGDLFMHNNIRWLLFWFGQHNFSYFFNTVLWQVNHTAFQVWLNVHTYISSRVRLMC